VGGVLQEGGLAGVSPRGGAAGAAALQQMPPPSTQAPKRAPLYIGSAGAHKYDRIRSGEDRDRTGSRPGAKGRHVGSRRDRSRSRSRGPPGMHRNGSSPYAGSAGAAGSPLAGAGGEGGGGGGGGDGALHSPAAAAAGGLGSPRDSVLLPNGSAGHEIGFVRGHRPDRADSSEPLDSTLVEGGGAGGGEGSAFQLASPGREPSAGGDGDEHRGLKRQRTR
jgi:hypothetical protein